MSLSEGKGCHPYNPGKMNTPSGSNLPGYKSALMDITESAPRNCWLHCTQSISRFLINLREVIVRMLRLSTFAAMIITTAVAQRCTQPEVAARNHSNNN